MATGAAARWVLVPFLLAGTGGWISTVRGQTPSQDSPTFRANATLIEVFVQVTNRDGETVRGLTERDFTVLQDGKPQPISQFAFVDRSIERSSPAIAEPPGSSRATAQAAPTGRAYVLLLDDLRVLTANQLSASRVARMFVEQSMEEGDLAAVVVTSGRSELEQPFTTDRTKLLRVIGAPVVSNLPPNPNTLVRRVTQRLEDTALWLKDVLPDRRKVLLYIGADVPGLGGFTDPTTPYPVGVERGIAGTARPPAVQAQGLNQAAQADDARRAVGALRLANVPVYPIAPAGLSALFGRGDDAATGASATTRGTTAAALAKAGSMADLAEQTGGLALTNSNEFEPFFKRIVQDTSSYYLLAYPPPEGMRPGTTHAISVEVARPGLDVRARKSVTAPSAR